MQPSTIGGLLLTMITVSLAGCAAPDAASVDSSSASSRHHGRSNDDSSDATDDSADSSSSPTTARSAAADANPSSAATAAPARPAAARPVIHVTFNIAAKQTFGGQVIGRACSDRGANLQNATFLDGTSMQLVRVDYPDKVIATVDSAALAAMKASLVSTGELDIPVDPSLLPASPYELAMIMGGDERFGSPQACGVSLQPTSAEERDARNFPNADTMIFGGKIGGTGCGTVGYVQAYYDAAQQKVIAQATSQLLLAAWDGESGFPAMQDRTPCDVNHSPLVLDLAGRGVTLGAPIADVFDVDGDGARDAISWVTSDDTPFLVRDANGNGRVDGIDEMFGNRTRDPSGLRTSQNGFESLARFDSTADGAIDDDDDVWPDLRLWFDENHDGRTDPGELETLASRGVRSIALSFVTVRQELWASGRVRGAVRQRGGATMSDGRILGVLDVWFDGQGVDAR